MKCRCLLHPPTKAAPNVLKGFWGVCHVRGGGPGGLSGNRARTVVEFCSGSKVSWACGIGFCSVWRSFEGDSGRDLGPVERLKKGLFSTSWGSGGS